MNERDMIKRIAQSMDETLTDEEADAVIARCVERDEREYQKFRELSAHYEQFVLHMAAQIIEAAKKATPQSSEADE